MLMEGGVDARMHLIFACGSVVLLVQELSAQGWESRKPSSSILICVRERRKGGSIILQVKVPLRVWTYGFKIPS